MEPSGSEGVRFPGLRCTDGNVRAGFNAVTGRCNNKLRAKGSLSVDPRSRWPIRLSIAQIARMFAKTCLTCRQLMILSCGLQRFSPATTSLEPLRGRCHMNADTKLVRTIHARNHKGREYKAGHEANQVNSIGATCPAHPPHFGGYSLTPIATCLLLTRKTRHRQTRMG